MKKKLKQCLLSVFCLFIFAECDKKLDLEPQGLLTDQNFYQTEDDFNAATYGVYNALLGFYYEQNGLGWYQSQFLPDDDLTFRANETNNNEDFIWNPQSPDFAWIWDYCYKGINRANTVIDNLPKANKFAEESKKTRYEGEAKFLRAYFYFILKTNFGDVPVVTKVLKSVEETYVSNSQPNEVWDLIISDLESAKESLPENYPSGEVGRATKGAASALLGKVFLYRAQWEKNPTYYGNAIAAFNQVNGYTLVPNYEDNFDVKKENNPESVFEVQFTQAGTNGWQVNDFYESEKPTNNIWGAGTGRQIMMNASVNPLTNQGPPGPAGYGLVHVTTSLQNEFEPGDPRRVATMFMEGDDYYGIPFKAAWSSTGSTPAKYLRKDDKNAWGRGFENISVNNERIIRFADVKLMLAEAKLLGNNDIAGAASLINEVRRRADPSGAVLPDVPSNLSSNEMFKALMHERRVELALEGHRYQDLVRWHRAGLINIENDVDFGRTPANSNWNTRNLIKPIPLRELDVNDQLKQNTEYLGG